MSLSPFSTDNLQGRAARSEWFNPGLPYFSTARCREALETYARAHCAASLWDESDLRTQAITPALWALPGGLFTYTLTPEDYTRYRRQRGVRLIAYLVLPPKEVPAWTHG